VVQPVRRTMRRTAVVLLLILLFGSISVSVLALPQQQAYPELASLLARAQAEGQVRIIVGFATPVLGAAQTEAEITAQQAVIQASRANFLSSIATLNATVKPSSTNWSIPFVALQVDEAALAALAASPEVVFIRADNLNHPTLASSTALIGATTAWSRGFTGTGQTVAVLDSGVAASHPFLGGRVVAEACFSGLYPGESLCPNGQFTQIGAGSSSPDTCINAGWGEDCYHGTHVAGIAAGAGASFSGVAKSANIIGVNVFSGGGGFGAYDSDVLSGLNHVYSLRNSYTIASVNMSLGGGLYSGTCDASLADYKSIVDQLRAVNIATVIATGNNGATTQISAPACVSTSISVGSTTDADSISWFSNRAPFMSLFAPGSSITSSIPGGGYDNWDGTSMATPHVAGAIALLKQSKPTATVSQILTALQSTGTSIAITGANIPRINVNSAINYLSPPVISTQPQSRVINYGATAALSVVASGAGPFTYQWYLGNSGNTSSPIGGATNASYTTPGLTVNTNYWVRVSNGVTNVNSNTANIWVNSQFGNLIQNGTFTSAGVLSPWVNYGLPTTAALQWSVSGGVLNFHRNTGTTQAAVIQPTGAPISTDSTLEVLFSLSNTSAQRKRVLVLVHDADFSDSSACTFWVPPSSPLQNYNMKLHTTEAWSAATLSIYVSTADSSAALQLDNVEMYYRPALNVDGTLCTDPNIPAPPGGADGANLINNGDFTAPLNPLSAVNSWAPLGNINAQLVSEVAQLYRSGTPRGNLIQEDTSLPASGMPLEATFQMGNSHTARMRVVVLIHKRNFGDLGVCAFWLPPSTPLGTYTMRVVTTMAWDDATSISFYPADPTFSGAAPAGRVLLDNVTLAQRPGLDVMGTECYEPGAVVPSSERADTPIVITPPTEAVGELPPEAPVSDAGVPSASPETGEGELSESGLGG
jgi:subtilisin family serine protease